MIGKLVFGGFGKNIFNPALMGRIFIAICFSSDLSVPEGLVVGGSDAAAGATIANVMQSSSGWLTNGAIEGYSVMDLFLGNYFAAMGETFTLLLIVIGIILIIRKDIQWRAPVFYIGTVGITTLIIGLLLNFKNPFLFAYYHLAAGGLMFAAVFMITDPVTTPTSRFGNCLVGVIAGLMTVLIRIGTNSAEGVMYSIAIVNLITPMIDGLVKGKTNARIGAKYGITFGTLALSIILTSCVAWSENGGRTIYSINGIDIAEYNTITENIPLDFISENNYKYKVYDKEITSEKAIDQETYGYAPAYYVCNSKKETIGVMYTVKVSQKIYNGYDYVNRSGTTSVVFDINNGNILAIYTNPAATTSHYSDLVVDAVNELDYTNLTNADLQAIEGKDFAVGASYTSAFLISSVQAAYDIYLAAFGA
jgi:hypothetical protein